MQISHTQPLPACFARHPAAKNLLHEADLRLTPHARLQAKLLVFTSSTAMRHFWRNALGKPLPRGTLGAVNSLATKVTSFRQKRTWLECDPRYFCVIGLTRDNLGAEIVLHEALHVGFAYAKRRRGDPWLTRHELDEEEVCYPAGMAAAAIIRALQLAGLIPP